MERTTTPTEDQHGTTILPTVRSSSLPLLLSSLVLVDTYISNSLFSPTSLCPFAVHRTSNLIPIPPPLYAPIPKFIKSTILFDFPFYKFNAEGEDAKKAVDEQRGQEEEGSGGRD